MMTDNERELFLALRSAVTTYQYASMTSWEREVTAEDREQAELAVAKYEPLYEADTKAQTKYQVLTEDDGHPD